MEICPLAPHFRPPPLEICDMQSITRYAYVDALVPWQGSRRDYRDSGGPRVTINMRKIFYFDHRNNGARVYVMNNAGQFHVCYLGGPDPLLYRIGLKSNRQHQKTASTSSVFTITTIILDAVTRLKEPVLA